MHGVYLTCIDVAGQGVKRIVYTVQCHCTTPVNTRRAGDLLPFPRISNGQKCKAMIRVCISGQPLSAVAGSGRFVLRRNRVFARAGWVQCFQHRPFRTRSE
jgi:hypothetical protein